MLTPVLFVSWSHVEMSSFSTWISLWKRMMNYWIRHVEKESIISICHALSSSLSTISPGSPLWTFAYLIVLAVVQPGLLWAYLSASHFSISFCVHVPNSPSQPFHASLRRCCLQLLHSWLGTQQDQGDRDWPERRGPKRVPSRAERLRPRPKQDPWKFLPLGHQWDLLSLPTFTSNTWFA